MECMCSICKAIVFTFREIEDLGLACWVNKYDNEQCCFFKKFGFTSKNIHPIAKFSNWNISGSNWKY